MKVDLIIENAAQLITCTSGRRPKRGPEMCNVGLIERGALTINEGKITKVGANKEIRRQFQAKKTIDASGKAVIPGFVDCHTHIVFAGNRLDEFELRIKGANYLELLASGGGINSTVEKTRNATSNELTKQSQQRLDEMLRNGTTTAEVKTGYGLDTITEFKMLNAIAELDQSHVVDLIPTFLAAHAVPNSKFQIPNFRFKIPKSCG